MIRIYTDAQEYGYDLYALTKSFFVGKEVSIIQEDDEGQTKPDAICLWINQNSLPGECCTGSVKNLQGSDDSSKGLLRGEIYLQIIQGEDIAFSVDTSYFPKEKAENQSAYKKEIKRFFYDVLVEQTGNPLPWGNLTGIRPTKLLMQMMYQEAEKQGKCKESQNVAASQEFDESVATAVKKRAYEEHRVGDKKAALGIEIAKREHALMETLPKEKGYSVYIGIPFCPSTCLYCSFTSFPIVKWKKRIPEYLDALRKELLFTREQMKDFVLDTVYIGGGTPSTLEPEELDRLLFDITSILPWENVKEFTVEAGRADSITREKLQVLRKYPVTRISVNPQTMKDETLKLIGRHHTVAQVVEAFHMVREEGFDNINMDIILGLPGETTEDVQNTVNEISKLMPDSLTVHSLAIKRASKMKAYIEEHGGFDTMDYEIAMEISEKAAREMGLEPYYLYRQKNMAGNLENTGYAKPGKYGIYNILIMEEVQSIVALGAGSVSKRVYEDGRIERCDNVKDINLYLEQIDEMIERKRRLFGDS